MSLILTSSFVIALLYLMTNSHDCNINSFSESENHCSCAVVSANLIILITILTLILCFVTQAKACTACTLSCSLIWGMVLSDANKTCVYPDKQIVSSRVMLLTLLSSIRYMSQAKHAEARELMYNGALLFFSYNQVHAALDPCFVGLF